LLSLADGRSHPALFMGKPLGEHMAAADRVEEFFVFAVAAFTRSLRHAEARWRAQSKTAGVAQPLCDQKSTRQAIAHG